MNLLFRWCFLALMTISFIGCETDDEETTPSTNNTPTNNNGGNSGGGNTSGAFISGDVDGINKTYPVVGYGSPSLNFAQAIAVATEDSIAVGFSIGFKTTLGVGTHPVYGSSLNASILVTISDTTRNGGQFTTWGRCNLNNSTIEFTTLDTVTGVVEGTFDVMAYQGSNCTLTDSVMITNGKFKFDYK